MSSTEKTVLVVDDDEDLVFELRCEVLIRSLDKILDTRA